MYKDKRVALVLECQRVAFASYSDLTSDEGKKHILAAKEFIPYRHYMFCVAARLVYLSMKDIDEECIIINVRQCCSPLTHIDHVIQIKRCVRNSKELLGKIASIDGQHYPEVNVTLDNGKLVSYASVFEFLLGVDVHANYTREVDELLRLDLRYVGQTDITEQYFRFDTHGTYAREADRLMKGRPDQELFIKLLQFNDMVVLLDLEDPTPEEAEDLRKLIEPMWEEMESQWVTFIEAAMIGGMNPPLNKHYKGSFPTSEHTTYSSFVNGPIDDLCLIIDEDLRRYSTLICGEYRRTFACTIKLDGC